MKYIHEIQYLIRNHRFEHYYLYENILRTFGKGIEINAKWKIGSNESWILGFCSGNNYNIYGLNFSKELLEEVEKTMDFNLLPNRLCFSGNKEIIEFLFAKNPSFTYEVYKERIFYETNEESFSKESIESNVTLRNANSQDLELLTKFNCQFFEEEYNGQNNQDFNEMKVSMKAKIDGGQFIVAEIENSIIGFCSRFKTEFDNEMIGTVFVRKEYRKSKAGTLLIKKMTENVLADNPKCWLMTDLNNVPSNKIMTNLNYHKIYEYTSGVMKKL